MKPRGTTKKPGRPRETIISGRHDYEPCGSLKQTAARFRTEFESMPPKLQAETVARVRRILGDEARSQRARPSPLKQLACEYHVWGTL